MAESVFAVTQTTLGDGVIKKLVDPRTLELGSMVMESKDDKLGKLLLSSGQQIDGIEVSIFGENKEKLEDGIVGEIGIKGEYLFEGYYGLTELTNERSDRRSLLH